MFLSVRWVRFEGNGWAKSELMCELGWQFGWNRTICIYSKVAMGSSQIQKPSSCSLGASVSTCFGSQPLSTHATCTLPAYCLHPPENGLTLLNFARSLTVAECFYVLSALLQQYYGVFKRGGKAVVSAGLCWVNELGEVRVQGVQAELLVLPAVSFVSVLSQVLEVVEQLGSEEWGGNGQCGYFRQRVLKTIYRLHGDDDLLYHELMAELFSFMEYNQFRTNLLPALLRRTPPQQPLLQRKQSHRRYESASFESFARREHQERVLEMSGMTKREEPLSLLGRQQDRQRTVYHRKMVHTEGEEYFREAQAFQNVSTARDNLHSHARNHISSQYSMNIANCQRQSSPRKAKVKFRKFTHKIHYDDEEDRAPRMKRNNTTNELSAPLEPTRTHAKSVLEDLARSVIVRDEPSSKSFIF